MSERKNNMTVTNMSKARPRIDFSLHKAPYKDFYDIQIFFPNGTNQSWVGLSEGQVRWLCEKYNPISTPLSIAIAPRFLPKSSIQKPNWAIRKV
ncbi:histidinol-phosphate/aromatic aminotransferase and cobyric acid decarboxylase [Lactococcus lactis]|uniref:histidinol-phosphate/aromatic aminotransferase and cobyric acid decarboxylase n=2 Tax=Lactococcus lactis TaxID=1358 RepID=UPI00288C7684|nr:histidinol-phosphate/aromatic aminotransferase and cobyric acid decarboxylase [Lactococcus lactis]MDT2922365.1 histidinol-phosphate/aromatic aminotransferase and cobyric acid decarboxylase [Lactococcus lactis]MDT2941400.1 histidinol-phosphate/aromatic aminotransferase and cobyric acid decarboxylase [Lactococcus lactis]